MDRRTFEVRGKISVESQYVYKHGYAQESETVDVNGLPEPIIQSIKQIVESIRDPNNLKWIAHIELSADPSRDVNETRGEAWEKFLLDPDTR